MYGLQKASIWKRFSAALFDIILVAIVSVGVMYLVSLMLDYSSYSARLGEIQEKYEQTYGVDLDISSEEYGKLSEQETELYDSAFLAFSEDSDAVYVTGMMMNFSLIMITFGLLVGYLAVEFAVPLMLGNGQTLGKKVFGIAVMRKDGIRISPILLFARTLLGKYTVGTMLPVLIVIMVYFGIMGGVGTVLLVALFGAQLTLLFATRAHTPIHDLLAQTVTVDVTTQIIFENAEEKERRLAEYADKQKEKQ